MCTIFEIDQAPDAELRRSPAAARVGALAARSGLCLSHFEHRVHLPLPDQWVAFERPDVLGTLEWRNGLEALEAHHAVVPVAWASAALR